MLLQIWLCSKRPKTKLPNYLFSFNGLKMNFSPSSSSFQFQSLPFKTVFENHRKSLIRHIASEASYVYIQSGQKLIQNAKNGRFWRVFENLKLAVKQCYQTDQFLQDKNWWKMPIQMRHFE
mgnify:CR=1 FL=1